MAVAGVVQFLREQVVRGELETVTDAQLLQRFVAQSDEAAFAALVRRHAAMVWGVCKRVLGHNQNAEDAFQATFMVLTRKAASIRPPGLLGNWLYGVAHHVAIKAHAMNAKRMSREKQLQVPITNAVAKRGLWQDLQPLLDQELSLLPEKYRAVIVLCDLEGKTRKEAALCLGVPEGTIAGRQARARAMLAKRLARHGFTVSGGSLAALLSRGAASASAPASAVVSTIKSASILTAGGALAANVAALTEGVVKAMLISKLKSVVGILVVLLGFSLGTVALSGVFAQGDGKRLDSATVNERGVQTKVKGAAEARVIQAPAQAQDILPLPRLSGVNLIMNKSVREELNLTADQVKDLWAGVHKLREKYKDEFAKHETREQAERAGLFAKVDKEVLKGLDAILKPEQAKRLTQIQLDDAAQRVGAGVFLYSDVAKELQLTDSQKQRAQAIFNQSCHDVTALAFSGATREEAWEEARKINKKAMDDVRSSLNDEQKKKLEEMTGKPFVVVGDVDFHPFHLRSDEHITAKKRVQDELKLTKDQVKNLEEGLRKVHERYFERYANVPAVRPGTDPAPGAALGMRDPKIVAELAHKSNAESKKVLAEVLKPEQANRLKQIEFQLEGLRALTNQEVALALKLTGDQKGQVKKLFEGISKAATEALNSTPPDPRESIEAREARNKAGMDAWNKAFKEATEKIPSLLTPEQRKRWEAMTGAPFQLEPVDAPKVGLTGKKGNRPETGVNTALLVYRRQPEKTQGK
jgi:RNA polymerase sigma factor (sigma-70 family)